MKFIDGTPNKDQQIYMKIIMKLDRDIEPDSISLKVPDYQVLEEEYQKQLSQASNNFERTKVMQIFERKRIVWNKLVQVKFNHIQYKFPFYFENIPMPLTNGTALEGTITTIFNKKINPIFLGKAAIRKLRYLLITPIIEITPDIIGEHFDLNEFMHYGKFELGTFIFALRHDIGNKILSMEGEKEELIFDDLLGRLNNDSFVQECLQKFGYLANRKIKPVDAPKSVFMMGYIPTECVGCIIPITENHMFIQVGDFKKIHKSCSFQLLQQLISIILGESWD